MQKKTNHKILQKNVNQFYLLPSLRVEFEAQRAKQQKQASFPVLQHSLGHFMKHAS